MQRYQTLQNGRTHTIFYFIDLIVTMTVQMMNYHIQHFQNYFGYFGYFVDFGSQASYVDAYLFSTGRS